MFLIPTLAYVTLRSHGVQTWLASKAATYLSDELGAEVSVGGVRVKWFYNVALEDINILDKQERPILFANELVIDVAGISFSRRKLKVEKLLFDKASLGMVKYPGEDEFNFQFLFDYFTSDEPVDTFRLPKWQVSVSSFEFRNSGLSFIDENVGHTDYGFDSNNFAFGKLNLSISNISFEDEVLLAEIDHFSVEESKGLLVEEVKANIMVGPQGSYASDMLIKTNRSRVELGVALEYDNYNDFSDFVHKVNMDFEIKPSALQLYELGYFITSLYGLDNRVYLKGNLSGTVNNFRGNEVILQYGNYSSFQGNFLLNGLPDIQETFLNFSVNRFVTNRRDIETFIIPYADGASPLVLPKQFQNMGMANFSGNLTGFIYDFVAYGKLQTAMGEIESDIAIRSNEDFSELSYNGNLGTSGLNLGNLLNDTDNFGEIAFDLKLKGKGIELDRIDVSMDGMVKRVELKGYDYRNIDISGTLKNKQFNGNLLIDDPNLFVDFNGLIDFGPENPYLNFTARIDDANLSKLNIYQRDSIYQSLVSTIVSVEGHFKDMQNLEGEIAAYSSIYREIEPETGIEKNYYQNDLISLSSHGSGQQQNLLILTSDFLDVQIEGLLSYDRLKEDITQYLGYFLPSRFERFNSADATNDTVIQRGEFEIHFKETRELFSIFFPQWHLSENVLIRGRFNTHERLFKLDGFAEFFGFAETRINDLKIHMASDTTGIEINNTASKLQLSDSIWMDRFQFISGIYNDTIQVLTSWENENGVTRNSGRIEGRGRVLSPSQAEFVFQRSFAYINDSLWNISPANYILIDSNVVDIQDFLLFKNDEYLKIDGRLSDHPDDLLTVDLNNFDIESLNYLLRGQKVDFGGISSGELVMSNLKKTPNISANLLIRDFSFNNDHLGDLSLESIWDAAAKAFKIDAEIIYYGNVGFNKPVIAKGWFYPEREDDNFDLDIQVENLRMSIFSRYLDAFTSNFRGLASGKLRLEGPLSSPELKGRARLVRTGFRVDFTNTAYSFAHDLEIGKDFFRFDNLTLNDTLGNSANVSGIIRHNKFMNFSVDISFLMDRIAALNTLPHHNELFYGRAFASGLLRVHGPVNDIKMDIAAQANRGTQFFLPLDYRGEVSESNFITFVPPDQPLSDDIPFNVPQIAGITLNFDLEVTPDSEIQIIFDSQIGDILRGRGFGDLKFEIDNQGAFNMYGDYTIQEGDYLFTLQNLINKRFRMQQGGTIRWSGDPYDADIDIQAIYRLRTSLIDLARSQSDTSDMYRGRVPVETVLHLQDKLFNPSISFEIQLPGGDESTREMIERIITTEQEMNRQVFSLLILNRFVPPEDGLNTALSYGMGSTSSELLSNQLSNWLSQISSDFDIGINYRPGDEITNQEIEVALSTQLFDDRVTIDGNVGVRGDLKGDNTVGTDERTSNIIGDVNVEVKITPEGRFRVKAFNRSNTFDVLNTNFPYTQGVGVFYRREFDSLFELFRKQNRTKPELPEFEEPEYPEIDNSGAQASDDE
ncbi:MAG: translocation/assembly module TamB domain-containing protein [Bacteroidales bacterium]